LNQPDDSRRLAGARGLTRNPVPPNDKSRVGNALVAMLADSNNEVADESRRALERVITAEQVPALVRLVANQRSNGRLRAMDMLVYLKDPRGAEAIAEYLPQFFDREKARQALEKLGEPAEPAVLKYLFHKDRGVREMAENLLRGYGTRGEAMLNQALADLKDSDEQKRIVILEWLAKQPFDEKFQPKVVAGVSPLLQTLDANVKSHASTVISAWGGKENVPALIKVVESKSGGFQEKDAKIKAMEALARLKDPRGAPPIAALLNDFWVQQQARQALESMGPVAEDAVLVYLNHPEARYHQSAKELLAQYNTESKKIVEQSMKDLADADPGRRQCAAKSLGDAEVVEEKKDEVSKALAIILVKEKDYHQREAALIGLEKWGTSNCVEPVASVFVVDRQSFRGSELRKKALTILSRLKDPRTAGAIISNFQDFGQRAETRQALMDLGPGAEDAVLQMLRLPDANLVKEACVILQAIGTEKSLKPLEGVTSRATNPRTGNAELAALAVAAHKTISARTPKDAPDGKDAKP
jgi:HEAT repeat protein